MHKYDWRLLALSASGPVVGVLVILLLFTCESKPLPEDAVPWPLEPSAAAQVFEYDYRTPAPLPPQTPPPQTPAPETPAPAPALPPTREEAIQTFAPASVPLAPAPIPASVAAPAPAPAPIVTAAPIVTPAPTAAPTAAPTPPPTPPPTPCPISGNPNNSGKHSGQCK
jgi:hypothetical protein